MDATVRPDSGGRADSSEITDSNADAGKTDATLKDDSSPDGGMSGMREAAR
jgi:hypothetical protein